MQNVIGDYSSRIEHHETVKSINSYKNSSREQLIALENLPLKKYPATSADLELRSRETKLNMSQDSDEFSSLQLYNPRSTNLKKFDVKNYKYQPARSSRKHHNKHSNGNGGSSSLNMNNNSSDSEEDYHRGGGGDDDEEDDKYCCDCGCCKCPWPMIRGAWCVKDACGIVCAATTWSLVLFAEFVIMFVIIIPAPYTIGNFLNTCVFQLLAFLALSSHAAAMLTDPGAVPLGNATPENIEKCTTHPGQVIYRCPRCVSIKPLRAHHCSVCKRCIRKMDHHCPWVNNCVGENNQKFFVLFTLYIFLISFHAAILIMIHMVRCVENDWTQCSSFSPAVTLVLLILLGFESLLFGIFTLVMFCTQVSAIFSDETQIESLKQEEPKWARKSKWLSMKSVFGTEVSIKWLSPFVKPNFKYLHSSKLFDV